jgi:RNA polymerase sigma factor (sigma-70 family)
MDLSREANSSNGLDSEFIENSGQPTKASTETTITYFDQITPENSDSIENLLERYNFQFIQERVKQTIQSFSVLQHLIEEITSEVYVKFWQRLQNGPVENPTAYIRKMIHNRCIDYMRRFVTETCHLVQSYSEGDLDILESNHVTANTEGLRDPAEEFEYKASIEECYQQVTVAIAKLSPRQQQAAACHLLRHTDDPQFLLELFKVFHIAMPVLHPGDKYEDHLLDASYTHARKALARILEIDLSQFKQKKHRHFRSLENRVPVRKLTVQAQ